MLLADLLSVTGLLTTIMHDFIQMLDSVTLVSDSPTLTLLDLECVMWLSALAFEVLEEFRKVRWG